MRKTLFPLMTASCALLSMPLARAAETAPAVVATVNKGDVAWMLTATLLVVMMSIPGLALFYGGMARAKNMLSVLMQVFVVFALVSVLWLLFGYSLAFSGGNAVLGKNAQVKGNVTATSVSIEGKINGNILAKDKIEMKASATVNGDIKARRLSVEDGVTFVGRSEVNPNSQPAPAPQAGPAVR